MGLAGCQGRGRLIAWSKKPARLSRNFFIRGAKGNRGIGEVSITFIYSVVSKSPPESCRRPGVWGGRG